MDQASKTPATPVAVLRAQQQELARVAEMLERLAAVATNKNAEVGSAVEAARSAIKEQVEALNRAEASAARATKAYSHAAEGFDQAKSSFTAGGKSLVSATRELKALAGVIRERRRQQYFLAAAFAAGLLILPALSFVPGLRTVIATAMMHDLPTARGRQIAGAALYQSGK